jgi:hypothetical protein
LQGVQTTPVAGLAEADFTAKKKIQLSGKSAGWPLGTLGHRFNQTLFPGEPMHDQTGLRETGESDHNGFRGLHD